MFEEITAGILFVTHCVKAAGILVYTRPALVRALWEPPALEEASIEAVTQGGSFDCSTPEASAPICKGGS